jgi:hypothetical protein
MVANDSMRMESVVFYIHFLWATPYLLLGTLQPPSLLDYLHRTPVCFILLWRIVGIATLAGFLVLFALLPFGLYMSRKTDSLRKQLIDITDERVRIYQACCSPIKTHAGEIRERDTAGNQGGETLCLGGLLWINCNRDSLERNAPDVEISTVARYEYSFRHACH